MDTLVGGAVSVSNPIDGVWDSRTAWRVVEEVRIGTLEGDGPDMFGSIGSMEVDENGNIYVYERQALELRVFGPNGEHVRTVGREGGGPGEFKQVIGMDWAADGTLWIVDPGNNRISVFDTAGTYVTSHRTIGNYIISPWPGGFDTTGAFYNYGIDTEADAEEQLVMVRYDDNMEPADTFQVPRYDAGDAYFDLRTKNSFWRLLAHEHSVHARHAVAAFENGGHLVRRDRRLPSVQDEFDRRYASSRVPRVPTGCGNRGGYRAVARAI
jgi:hypothetical protein